MPLSFWKFASKVGKSAYSSATGTNKRLVSFVGGPFVVIIGAYLGISALVGEFLEALKMTWWIPISILVVLFIGFLFYHAYCVYWESESGREKIVKEYEDFKKPKVAVVGGVQWNDGPTVGWVRYWFKVQNVSAENVDNCRVRIMDSTPKIAADPLTLPLPGESWPDKRYSTDLSPGDVDVFCLCDVMDDTFTIPAKEGMVPHKSEKHILKMCIIGRNTLPFLFAVTIDPANEQAVVISSQETVTV